MPACSPLRPSLDVVNRLISAVAWAKICQIATASTAPGSPERLRELEILRQALAEPRHIVDEILTRGQAMPRDPFIALRACEQTLLQLEADTLAKSPPGDAP